MQSEYTQHLIPVRHTVLFFDGLPVRYKIYRNENVFLLDPADNTELSTNAPQIVATRCNGIWQIEELTNQNLIDQVNEDLDLLVSEPLLNA